MEGVKWHQKAAAQGNAGAQYHLAGHYELGGSVPQDLVEAYSWYLVATKGGWDKAVQSRDETKRKLSESQIALTQRRAADLFNKYGSGKWAAWGLVCFALRPMNPSSALPLICWIRATFRIFPSLSFSAALLP